MNDTPKKSNWARLIEALGIESKPKPTPVEEPVITHTLPPSEVASSPVNAVESSATQAEPEADESASPLGFSPPRKKADWGDLAASLGLNPPPKPKLEIPEPPPELAYTPSAPVDMEPQPAPRSESGRESRSNDRGDRGRRDERGRGESRGGRDQRPRGERRPPRRDDRREPPVVEGGEPPEEQRRERGAFSEDLVDEPFDEPRLTGVGDAPRGDEPLGGDADEPRRGRRRRRRGRGRGRRGRDEGGTEREPLAAGDRDDRDELEPFDDPIEGAIDDLGGDPDWHEEGSAAPSSAEREGEEPRRRRRRRRGGRGRSRSTTSGADSDRESDDPDSEAIADAEDRLPAIPGEETDDNDADVKAGHRGIPSWDEVIGSLVQSNLEARAKNPQGPPRGRGRGRGRGGRDSR